MANELIVALPPRVKNIVGEKFGRLTVLAFKGRGAYSYFNWECQCECGTVLTILSRELKSGDTKSCGCLKREVAGNNAPVLHGMSKSPEFRIWAGIFTRLNNPNAPQYKNYGGRGITISVVS
jgi:hypothetical protein